MVGVSAQEPRPWGVGGRFLAEGNDDVANNNTGLKGRHKTGAT
jgi:hypothetical protein